MPADSRRGSAQKEECSSSGVRSPQDTEVKGSVKRVFQSHQNDQACPPMICSAYPCRSPGPCTTLSGQKAQCSAATCNACSRSTGGAATLRSSVLNPTLT